jgi:transcriptional regulator GlxA family with amidase domain
MDVCYFPGDDRSTPAHCDIVTRAETFAREHLSDAVGIGELCRITGVSERTLRNAFYRARGSSPKRVLLRLRLDKVREALIGGAGTATVTSVATSFGFYDLGRFAGRYKAVFGEYPSDTLRARAVLETAAPTGGLSAALESTAVAPAASGRGRLAS